LISLTRDNIQELTSIDKELADATDVENYELADVLDSRMNVIKKTISQLLRYLYTYMYVCIYIYIYIYIRPMLLQFEKALLLSNDTSGYYIVGLFYYI
jgi:hypothetical protein